MVISKRYIRGCRREDSIFPVYHGALKMLTVKASSVLVYLAACVVTQTGMETWLKSLWDCCLGEENQSGCRSADAGLQKQLRKRCEGAGAITERGRRWVGAAAVASMEH